MDSALPARLSWSVARSRPRLARALATLLILPVLVGTRPASGPSAAWEAAVEPHRFALLQWEQHELLARADRLAVALLQREPGAGDAGPLIAYLQSDGAHRDTTRRGAERVVEQEITRELLQEGLALRLPFAQPLVFPPVSAWIGPPPQVLVTSPRDRIEVLESVLLQPATTLPQAEAIEERVDAAGLSSLVVPIGGLSTYPTMILDTQSPQALLATAAHEWAHGYLFFRPLGQAYFADPQARAINETVADLFGRELAEQIAHRLGLPPPPPRPPAPRPVLDFASHMRQTRREVDRLLGLGKVAEAERYMEQRRRELVAAGYDIRKLNQAYFAFYGSYTEGPAAPSTSPIPDQVRRLRQQSGSPGAFLRRAALLRDADDLARAVGDR